MINPHSTDAAVHRQNVFHISEDEGISQFTPRPVRPDHPLGIRGPVVWAIGGRLLHNYLLPRDCPRVCFHIGQHTSKADSERFLGQSSARFVMAIESVWLARVIATRLFCYELPGQSFRLVDSTADYWVGDVPVTPLSVRAIDKPLDELAVHQGELRICPSLWPLYDSISASTLDFSMIRMANATTR